MNRKVFVPEQEYCRLLQRAWYIFPNFAVSVL